MIERDEVAVQAQRRRASDLEMQVGGVALDQLLEDRLEVEHLARRGGRRGGGWGWGGGGGDRASHWERSGRAAARIRRAARRRREPRSRRPRPRIRSRS